MRRLLSFLWVLSTTTYVIGNTESVNFVVQDSPAISLPFTDKWPLLSPEAPTLTIDNMSSARGAVPGQFRDICHQLSHRTSANPEDCSHEFWLVLDLDAANWHGYRKFTLRLSWPAFYPTDMRMSIFEPDDLLPTRKGQSKRDKTRRRYARIQATHFGVMTPTSKQIEDSVRYRVPVVVTLEPLHLGAIPSSVIPVLIAILLVILSGLPLAAKFDHHLRTLAQKVWEDELVSKRN